MWSSLLCRFSICDEKRNVGAWDFYFYLKLFQFVVDVLSMRHFFLLMCCADVLSMCYVDVLY